MEYEIRVCPEPKRGKLKYQRQVDNRHLAKEDVTAVVEIEEKVFNHARSDYSD
jgi:hypothetical protein